MIHEYNITEGTFNILLKIVNATEKITYIELVNKAYRIFGTIYSSYKIDCNTFKHLRHVKHESIGTM
jgi:hypothetical protein